MASNSYTKSSKLIVHCSTCYLNSRPLLPTLPNQLHGSHSLTAQSISQVCPHLIKKSRHMSLCVVGAFHVWYILVSVTDTGFMETVVGNSNHS